jgi:uncharacterized protein (TIGR02145 family)
MLKNTVTGCAGLARALAVTIDCGSCGNSNGTLIAGLCWANTNVAASGTFATLPDMYTELYQFNRNTAWSPTGFVSGWNPNINENSNWANNGQPPCPTGWRLPTRAEFQALDIAGGGNGNANNVGSTWVNANAKGNAVAGRFYGSNHATCTLYNMPTCIFLPAVNYRNLSGILGTNNAGNYWASTQDNTINGQSMGFTSMDNYPTNNYEKTGGFSIRCVQ